VAGNTFGHSYRVTTFGESHGGAVGAVIDGSPPGHKIDLQRIQDFLNRRRPGQSQLTSPRGESDELEVLSGLEGDVTLGTPIAMLVRNRDVKSGHYRDVAKVLRPSHADFTTLAKYGIAASSGGGRASARETIGRVLGAAVAEQILENLYKKFAVVAFVDSIHDIAIDALQFVGVARADLAASPVRCPDAKAARRMEQLILATKDRGDSLGGTITCVVRHLPPGIGDPVFAKLEGELARAMLSLPASKGFEVGLGFRACQLFGSEHNDAYVKKGKRIGTATNRSGGIQGGISNGEPIILRVAFKPTATIFKKQPTLTKRGRPIEFEPAEGRHDPCVLPRAVPMVEAMALLVIMDGALRQLSLRAAAGSHARFLV
jgi:chorismate synthase